MVQDQGNKVKENKYKPGLLENYLKEPVIGIWDFCYKPFFVKS